MPCDIAHLNAVVEKFMFNDQLPVEPEMRLRQGAARMYYVAFHVIRDAMAAKSGNTNYRVEHRDLIQWLQGARHAQLQAVGSLMKQASKFRKRCDYELSSSIGKQAATDLVNQLKRDVLNSQQSVRQLILHEQNPLPPPS